MFGNLRSESSEVAVLHEPPALHAKVVLYKVRQSALFEPVANSLPCAHEYMYVSMYVCMYELIFFLLIIFVFSP